MLPDCCKWCDAVLAEVDQDVHAFIIHGVTHVDIVVRNVCTELFQGGSGT
jgi:hypothetical protein